jgi:signal transduction histidine kinase/CheY-like chemotaxis protein
LETAGITTSRRQVLAGYIIASIFLFFDLTPYLIEGVRPFSNYYRAIGGPAFWPFFVIFFLVASCKALWTLSRLRKLGSEQVADRAKLLTIALSLLSLGGIHDMIPLLGWDYYPGTGIRIIPWGTLIASLYGLLLGYSILSDQLFDVRISISRHSATGLRLCFLGGIVYISMLSVGAMFPSTVTRLSLTASLIVMLVSAIVTSHFFPKLFGSLTGKLERAALGDHFEYQDKVGEFIESTADTDQVQRLLDETTDLVHQQLNLSAVGIAIVSGDPKTHGSSVRCSAVPPDWMRLLCSESPLLAFFRSTGLNKIDVRDDLLSSTEARSARELLNAESLQIAFSIGYCTKAPLGILVIGPRRNGRSITKLDIELLSALCRSLVFRVERIAIIQNEELRHANRAKDRFLASINHEIRNPLNGISGIVQMLRDGNLDPRSIFLLNTLAGCAEQLRSTMDDVLDFTRIETDTVTVEPKEVEIVALVKTTCAAYDPSGVRITLDGLPADPVFLNCDAGKIRQILSNYLGNALKYGDPAAGQVTLKVCPSFANRAVFTISVTSSGADLTPAEMGVLFTALTRGRRARETNAYGTGLGLALCKKLAAAMGGAVGVSSQNGKTTFWFTAEFGLGSGKPTADERTLAQYSGLRALAIEDEAYNRLVLAHYLAKLGISAVWTEDGESAFAAAQSQPFDVIIMDWLLPDMEGNVLLEKLRTCPSATLPPIIVLSAYSTTSKQAECLDAGAIAFISKPVDIDKLTAALQVCAFPQKAAESQDDKAKVVIDLSSLVALGNDGTLLAAFAGEIHTGVSRMSAIWIEEPDLAALVAHRLRAQMMLIRAKECAGRLEVLEQAFKERWPRQDTQRLVNQVETEICAIAAQIQPINPSDSSSMTTPES